MSGKRKLIVLVFLFLTWAGPAGARPAQDASGSTPPPSGSPVPVRVGIYLVDITNIDETRNTFDLELDVLVSWTDPRMAFDPVAAGTDRRVHIGSEAERAFQGVWTPQIVLANPVGRLGMGAKKLTIHADGRMDISAQINATCRADLDFHRFPFDSQVLPIVLESFAWNNTAVELIDNPERTGFTRDFRLAEWNVKSFDSRMEDVTRVRDETPFSDIRYEIRIQRKSGYFLWKIFLTVFIIVSLTWVVFWMSDERLGRRAGISSSGILTVIAYQFVTTSSLPRVSYLTVADRVMTVSIIIIAATMVVSVLVDRMDPGKPEARLRVDRACRWIFPVVYLLLLGLVIGPNGVF